MHGRHVIVDAVGSLYSTCRRALASPEDSPERALARSALARCARKWGCTSAHVRAKGALLDVNDPRHEFAAGRREATGL